MNWFDALVAFAVGMAAGMLVSVVMIVYIKTHPVKKGKT